MKLIENILHALISLVSVITTFIVVGILAYYIACCISPTVFFDTTTGEQHGLMPLGQSIIAIAFATIGSITTFILVVKYYRKK